ncbi:hypothetical protein D3H65_28225 [Paraflavitalea soli]|uniref:Uncharacterized protein n=1 Tax=Paraflavitalea soli TaxID=2315862 RepID=A0A3B7MSZ4_9BACT|nr:hypothetical protein [Paraflavitalea soli]AXY77632.1 hypothetical protein D3H65_28225 [Paraflavitalea soli]
MYTHQAKGQGCSDAGFCTINALMPQGPETVETKQYNQVKFGLSNGKADHDITIWSFYMEYSRSINKQFSIDTKLTGLSQNGSLTSAAGLSDIYLNANYTGISNAFFTTGIKLPLTDGNKKKNGASLPMDYQSSLGTTDLILGIGYRIKKAELVIAWQQPLTQNNNAFLSTDHPGDPAFTQFQSTNKYVRKGDVLLRVSYPLILNEKWKLTPGILPIYHLSEDEFTDASGKENTIAGSQGLTFNGNLFLDYSINKSSLVQLSFGTPFIARDVRPDGLTRKYVVTLEYRYRF